MDAHQDPSTGGFRRPAPAAASRPGWLIPVLVSAATLVVTLVGIGIFLAATRGGSGPAAAKTITVSGGVTVPTDIHFDIGEPCDPLRGYGDIGEGAAVAISDSSGKTVAIGKLGAGTVSRSNYPQLCRFAFSVESVPAGLGFYGIEVSHRGRVQYSESDITGKPVELSLGTP